MPPAILYLHNYKFLYIVINFVLFYFSSFLVLITTEIFIVSFYVYLSGPTVNIIHTDQNCK